MAIGLPDSIQLWSLTPFKRIFVYQYKRPIGNTVILSRIHCIVLLGIVERDLMLTTCVKTK